MSDALTAIERTEFALAGMGYGPAMRAYLMGLTWSHARRSGCEENELSAGRPPAGCAVCSYVPSRCTPAESGLPFQPDRGI